MPGHKEGRHTFGLMHLQSFLPAGKKGGKFHHPAGPFVNPDLPLVKG